ncbi:PIR Superfamily Protein [Plasmodium ovale curtisi]|uniref:PIR Superfamily Protein n=1 Tax=Plasmodium ovale curtisi TaxID=864141 RepID=A0A1A8XEG2_PLAOA|nr:PIR Superfamily Protein [Plasmodium ovale curtisi]
MPLEIQTIYNAAYSNFIFKNKLDSYKNDGELENNYICSEFTSSNLISESNEQMICKAVILFFRDLKEQKYEYGGTKHDDITYRDNGCKHLFYWLYTHIKKNEHSFKNTLSLYKQLYKIYDEQQDNSGIFNKYIDVMNEHTIEKLVKLTNLYNSFDKFFTENENKKEKEVCKGDFIDLYNYYIYECRNGYDYDFCDELKNFRKKYNSFIKYAMKCEEKYLLPPVEGFNIVGTTVIPFSLISVTSLIIPILYKFTALGPWIRRLIGKNKNVWQNINEETNNSLNTYEIGEDNFNMGDYNIAYNSS